MPKNELGILETPFREGFEELFLLTFTKELIKNSITEETLHLEETVRRKEESEKIEKQKSKQKQLEKEKQEKIKLEQKKPVEQKPLPLALPPPPKKPLTIKEHIKAKVKEKIQSATENLGKILPQKDKEKSKQIEMPPKREEVFFKSISSQPYQQSQRKKDFSQFNLTLPEIPIPTKIQMINPISTASSQALDLGKLSSFAKDPLVESIECHGSDEQIIINGKRGTQKTEMNLTREEIDTIIQKFSELSKTPIQEGVFKVAVGRYILLAIVSEVIEPKFIIKKIPLISEPPSFIK